MSLALFNAVPTGSIEILYDEQNQPWFKRAHVGKFLDLSDIHKSLDKPNECEMCTRNDFEPTRSNTPGLYQQLLPVTVGLDPKINKIKLTFFCQFMVLCMLSLGAENLKEKN